jgi:hypothetical protein
MSDITISVIQPPSTTINVGVDETTLIQAGIGLPPHSVTHISGGSDEINHNLLGGLQGGSGNEFYHLNSGQYFNLVTGEIVRPTETGQFYSSSNPSGYTATGYVTGVSGNLQTQITTLNNQTDSYYPRTNPSGYTATGYVTGISGALQTQITTLNNATGSYVLNSQTGVFYPRTNPSGYITGVNLSFSGNYYTKDESESRYVNTTGAETILGDKTFHDKVYINNLYVTGLETIINTTNTNVASNYLLLNLTGGAVDGGIFFITGSGLGGINDSGAIIGFDHSDKFKFGIGTRASDLSTLNTIAAYEQVTGISGSLQTQISTLNHGTGNYALKSETGNFITNSQTGQFYSNSNPSGFITGIDLSSYATQVYVTGISGNLQGQITNLNNATGSYILNSQTGDFYASSNPSGFITGINNLVFTTGDQTISGSKVFDTAPTFSNEEVKSIFIATLGATDYISNNNLVMRGSFGSSEFSSVASTDGVYKATYNPNYIHLTINGDPPDVYTYNFPQANGTLALDSTAVMLEGNQTIAGVKTFNSRPFVNGTGVMLSGEATQSNLTIEDSNNVIGLSIFL